MKPAKLSSFRIDCILSALTDFMALSIFIHQYLFYRKGFEFIVVFSCLLLINLTFLTFERLINIRMRRDEILQQNNHVHDIMATTALTSDDECKNFDNWIRKIERPAERNYSFEMVIDEINSIYS